MVATIANEELGSDVRGKLNALIVSALVPTADVKTGAYTAVAGDLVLTNSSGGPFTVTAPLNPSHGDTFALLDVDDSWSTNNVTVGRNGQNIEGAAEDLVLDGGRMCVLTFVTGTGWKIAMLLATAGTAWGGITGTLSDQTDLDSALDGKQPLDSDLTALAALTTPATKLGRLEALSDLQETASFTFALGDQLSVMVRANHASTPITATVPANASVAFPLGSIINICQWGAAAVTIAAAGGVTINKSATKTLVLAERYAVVTLWKQATDTWLLFGHLTDA